MEKKQKQYIKDRHKYLLLLIRKNAFQLILAMICMMFLAITNAGMAVLVKPLIDDIFVSNNVLMLKLLPLMVTVLYVIRGFSMYGQDYFMSYVGENIIFKLKNKLYEQIQKQSLAFYYDETTGGLMSRITNDVNLIINMVSTAVTGSLRDVFTIFTLTFVIFYRDWEMALFAFVILPLAFYPIVKFGRRIRKVSTKTQEANANLNEMLFETFAGNKIVKAFGMEDYEKNKFFQKTKNIFELNMKVERIKALTSPVMEFLGGMAIAFVIWYGGFAVMNGYSTPGNFFSFLAAVFMLYDPIKKLSKINNNVQRGMAAVDRVFDVIELEPDIVDCENPESIPDTHHHVVFKDVYFKYKEDTVLHNININVKPGEILALVGMSGGGKTTLVNLIPRFYDVTRGSVLIDDIDVRSASLSSLRNQIAIVSQEPILFNDTVKNNIAYGNTEASFEEIKKVAKSAYAYEFIQELPEKFDTKIGESGNRLSGGQKQRLSIARALLKNAPILILDEATSSLDSEAEKLVQKALENLMKGRTTFVIAHRLSTIAYSDRIAVILDGKICEEGKHDDLMALKGEYFKLHSMQFSQNGN